MLHVGDRFGPYEITGLLGEGGWGHVLRARDAAAGIEVALKLVRGADNPATRARFLREGRLAARVSHGNVVRILDVDEIGGTPFIAMELCPGSPMSVHLGSPKVSLQRRLGWLVQAARGLTAVHDAGLVHRDVKPANLMIMPDDVVKLIDFGFAKDLDPEEKHDALTKRGASVGTPAYMAPEQLAGGEIDHRADQFAWGLVGFALVTGTRLRVDDPTLPPPPALQKRLLEGGATEAVAQVLLRAFRLPREERFASMREAGDALLAAIPGLAVEKARPLFCPRCATQLDAQRRCAKCEPPAVAPARLAIAGGAGTPAVTVEERARWRFEVRAPDLALTLAVAHVRRDGLVLGLTPEGRGFVLEASGAREIHRPPLPFVRCAATTDDGALWVGSDGGAAARLDKDGAWSLVQPATGEDIPLCAAPARDGGVFFAGSRPGGGVFSMLTRTALHARQETPVVLRGVVMMADGRAFGVGGTTLFKTSGFGLASVDTPARAPLVAIARWGNELFVVGAAGTAICYERARQTTTTDPCETREHFSHVCAAGPHLAYATAGQAEILRRDPESGLWQAIGGPFAGRRPRAIAGTGEAVTVVLDDGAIVQGRRS